MAKISLLPEELEEDTVRRMKSGDIGYTVPWAMWADAKRQLWINNGYSVEPNPFGTACMKIKRVIQNDFDGVIVFRRTIGDHRYTPTGTRPYFSNGEEGDLPVMLRG